MTELEKLESVNKWQNCDMVHSLTCYEHSHIPLIPRINEEGNCELYCKHCDYVQKWIPDVVFGIDEMIEQGKQMRELMNKAINQQREKDSHF